jgi:hypothetical protein
MVVVDTEEEFDWSRDFSREETNVSHMRYQQRLHEIWSRYGVKPTYVVDFPIASQKSAYALLRGWSDDGQCDVGAHLHPWVNPPFEEKVCKRNSFPGNLPPALERAKLLELTELIERNLGRRPKIYKAGRYGVGSATTAVLAELGYEIDVSIVPHTDFTGSEGPDFTNFDVAPFWLDPSERLLEIPLTVAWCGRLRAHGRRLQPWLSSRTALRLRTPGIFARLGLLERIRLTPEGNSLVEMKRLVDTMLHDRSRLFHLTYHSPSVVPGNTPYVRSEQELTAFLLRLERFCDYFFGTRGGRPTTAVEVRAQLLAPRAIQLSSVKLGPNNLSLSPRQSTHRMN